MNDFDIWVIWSLMEDNKCTHKEESYDYYDDRYDYYTHSESRNREPIQIHWPSALTGLTALTTVILLAWRY